MNSKAAHTFFWLLFVFATVGIFASLYLAFILAPDERLMGPVQRILYFHAGSATASYFAIGLCFVAALMFLSSGERFWDSLVEAAGEVGFLLCTVVLVTGMIWGYSAWNTVFRFEPRLVSFLMLWLVLLSFVLVRSFASPERRAHHSAVLAILGALLVPVMIYSIKLLPQSAQLHPEVVSTGGLKDSRFTLALLGSMGSLVLLQALLIALRVRVSLLENQLLQEKESRDL